MKKISKKVILMLVFIVLVLIGGYFLPKVFTNKNEKPKIDLNNNMLSFMIETTDGNYEQSQNIPLENYIFNPESSGCDNGGKISWNMETSKIQVTTNKSDKCHAVFDKYDFTKSCKWGYEDNFGCYLIKNKDNTLIYHDGKPDYEDMENYELEAGDLSYRFTGGNDVVKNYVCFGSDDATCPDDNLFRVIGLYINEEERYNIKLIKNDVANNDLAGSNETYTTDVNLMDYYKGKKSKISWYLWQKDNDNSEKFVANWFDSTLNTVNLNDNYLNTFTEKWKKLIHNYPFQVGGADLDIYGITNAKMIYDYELGNKSIKKYDTNDIIGLMYISDYLYAADSKYWSYTTGNSEIKDTYRLAINDNWMYMGIAEWTITKNNFWDNNAFFVSSNGDVITHYAHKNDSAIRPAFYLKKEIKRIDGDGTINNPYRIS